MRKLVVLFVVVAACGGEVSSETTVDALPATTTSEASAETSPATTSATRDLVAELTEHLDSFGIAASPEPFIEDMIGLNDERYAAVFIELMRAMEIGLLRSEMYFDLVGALQDVTGQEDLTTWPEWVTWYAATDLVPLPGFRTLKGQLLEPIDERFPTFFKESYETTIRVEEIVWGGVQVDGIPSLDNPTHVPAADADYLEPTEPVFGVSINGDHRAYPLRIMDWHEMTNDVVGGIPVSLAYCTLCGAGVLYDGRVGQDTYTFGSSGFLMRSNKLMFDRVTNTLWNQLTGEPVLGELVASNIRLDILPVIVTSWDEWVTQHPDTVVLDVDTGFDRTYEPGAAYGGYFASDGTMFPAPKRLDVLDEKDRVFALQIDGLAKAYPTDVLVEAEVVNDTLGDTGVVVIARRGDLYEDGRDGRTGAQVGWHVGAEARAYASGGAEFVAGEALDEVLDDAGAVWMVTEEALVGPGGQTLERLPGHLAYWFGWFNFFPTTDIYDGGNP